MSYNVQQLLETLSHLVKQHPETKDLPVSIVKEIDYDEEGEPKSLLWMSFEGGKGHAVLGQELDGVVFPLREEEEDEVRSNDCAI